MDVPTSDDGLMTTTTTNENLIKPVPKPFSIEALMSDTGPKKTNPIPWNNIFNNPAINHHHRHNNVHHHNNNHNLHHINKDTDSDGSLDMDIVQDLSNRRCEKDDAMNLVKKNLKNNFRSKRHFANKFYLEKVEKTSKDHSFITNIFCGKIETRQIFPYPDILNKEQRETLRNLVKPVEQFFYEVGNNTKKNLRDVDTFKRLWELGAFSLQVPKSLGGLGLCNTQYARLVEIVGAHDLGVGITLGAHQSMGYKGILLYGNEAQKNKYLPKVTNGEFAAFCLTEPACGLDVGGISTRADLSPDGKNYVLNGSKVWISSKNNLAHIMTVFAKTESIQIKDQKLNPNPLGNVTAFIVENSFDGITFIPTPTVNTKNERKLVEVKFVNVKIPKENVLGGIGNGHTVAVNILNNGRFGMAASLAGTMRSCTNKALKFVNSQNLFGERLHTFAAIQKKLARMAILQYATESMAYIISSNMDKGSSNYALEAAISKCFASEAAWYCCDEAIEIVGGIGYLKESELEDILKNLRTFRIFEGTNDVLRLYIALTGIQYAMPNVEKFRSALRAPFDMCNVIFKELYKKALSQIGMNSFFKVSEGCHSNLTYSAYELSRGIDNFGLAISYAIMTYGKALETEQFLLNKISNCAIDIYASACILSRASNSLKHKLKTSKHETLMTRLWVKEASRRIMENSKCIMNKKRMMHYKNISDISKTLCESGKIPTCNPLNL